MDPSTPQIGLELRMLNQIWMMLKKTRMLNKIGRLLENGKMMNVNWKHSLKMRIIVNWKNNFLRKNSNNMMKKKRSRVQKIGWTTWKSLALSQ